MEILAIMDLPVWTRVMGLYVCVPLVSLDHCADFPLISVNCSLVTMEGFVRQDFMLLIIVYVHLSILEKTAWKKFHLALTILVAMEVHVENKWIIPSHVNVQKGFTETCVNFQLAHQIIVSLTPVVSMGTVALVRQVSHAPAVMASRGVIAPLHLLLPYLVNPTPVLTQEPAFS